MQSVKRSLLAALIVVAQLANRAVRAVKAVVVQPQGFAAALVIGSFSIDVNGLLSSAESIFNGLFPVFAIAIGITIGLGLIALIAREIRKSF